MTTISFVISIISLSLCVSGFFFLRWYISQRTDASRLLEEYRDEVHRLISEIDAATDRDSRLVEERIKNLRTLLDDTDKRISVYTRELQRSRNSEAIYKKLGRGIREALDSIPAASENPLTSASPPPPEELESSTAPETASMQEMEETTASTETTAPVEATAPTEINELPFTDEEKGSKTRGEKKQKKRKTVKEPLPAAHPEKHGKKLQIAQLAIQGLSPPQIASKLGISSAEVELALQLLNIGSGE